MANVLSNKTHNKSINVDRFYTPRRYRSALCKTVKLFQSLATNMEISDENKYGSVAKNPKFSQT